jgi:hypothetical protein
VRWWEWVDVGVRNGCENNKGECELINEVMGENMGRRRGERREERGDEEGSGEE